MNGISNKVSLTEGNIQNIDDENVTVAVSTDVPKELDKVEKDDKQSFEEFKTLYKDVITMKCKQDFGDCEDQKLWEDAAKELFLQSKNYILDGEEFKSKEDLQKEPEKEKKTENVIVTPQVIKENNENEFDDIKPGDEFVNEAGSKIVMLEPTETDEYNFKIINTNTNEEGTGKFSCTFMRDLLKDNHYKKVESKLMEKLNSNELITFSKKFLEAKSEEDLEKLCNEIQFYSEPTYKRVKEIIDSEGSVQYKAQQISDILYQINDPKGLVESNDNDITYIFEQYDWKFDITTKDQLGSDYSYHTLVKTVDEAEKFNYHSDYWGDADTYQEEVVDVVRSFEPYIDEEVTITYDDGEKEKFKVIGVLIDKQYNSISHLKILVEPLGELKTEDRKSIKQLNATDFVSLIDNIKKMDLWDGKDETFKDAVEKYYSILDTQSKLKNEGTILSEEQLKEEDEIEQIQQRIKAINKQLAYIRRRDAVSLSIGSENEKFDLYSERGKLNARLKKLKNKKTESKDNEGSEYDYMLLSRLKSDCDYFLGNGNRYEKHLWAGNVDDQIAKMKELYNKLPEKPEWLTMEDIENYEKEMKQEKSVINESITNLDDAKSKIIKWYKDKDYDCETIMHEAKRYMTSEDWHYMKEDADDTIGDSTFEEYYSNEAINEVIEHISAYMDTDSVIDWAQTLTLRESKNLTKRTRHKRVARYKSLEEGAKEDLGIEPGSDEEAKLNELQDRNFKEEFNAMSKKYKEKYKELIPVNKAGLSSKQCKELAAKYNLDADMLYWVANIGDRVKESLSEEKTTLEEDKFFNLYQAFNNLYGINKMNPSELIEFINDLKKMNRISDKDFNVMNDYANKWQDLINKTGYESSITNESKEIKTEDQYEAERRKGRPNLDKIAKEVFEYDDYYVNIVDNYKDEWDFVKDNVAEVAAEYNLREQAAEAVMRKIYKMAKEAIKK